MRQLVPVAIDAIEPRDAYADVPDVAGRPSVRLNMIASVDGATTVAGVSGGLGGPADRAVFKALRSLADVVLVAAGTVRAERYGPAAVPLAVVSRSLSLDWDSDFFAKPKARPLIVTCAAAPPAALIRAEEVADVVVAGEDAVDLVRAVAEVGERGYGRVLAEGGPSMNSQLVAAGVLDELCLTVSPRLVGGEGKRILAGSALDIAPRVALHAVYEQDDFLFVRYRL